MSACSTGQPCGQTWGADGYCGQCKRFWPGKLKGNRDMAPNAHVEAYVRPECGPAYWFAHLPVG